MKTVYDVRQLLKKFGTIIYIGDRIADLELMEEELIELYKQKLLTNQTFLQARHILNNEMRYIQSKVEKSND
ncbi:uncharacterized protein YqgQ [Gracilibacillus halotolerans]|uniref:Uncharacterized protein YqgQ n=1 Tax=Gracilibacillus halotolerans TaxID=74386 RepID=A0A841RKR2_9BACI|nr:YqgQ family protein [Gracilibacillus halotolerans]MBB6511785.1 uncharacterized protein YqgQ [Gracilibacillus halotolerans]